MLRPYLAFTMEKSLSNKTCRFCVRHANKLSNHAKEKEYVKKIRDFPQNTFRRQKEKKDEPVQEKVVKEKKKVDDKNRHKPFGLTAWAPVDDVYMVRNYPKPVYETSVAIEMLKNFQKLDFGPENQPVYINLRLDMKLEKKVHFGWLFLKPNLSNFCLKY